jgi:catechol 2,3-dioxygenase-like lactoylglutathione lyase family enzyme
MLEAGSMQTKLIVADLEKSADFYSEVLELTQAMRFESSMNHRPMDEIMLADATGDSHPLVLIKFLDVEAPTHGQVVFVFFTDDIDAFLGRVERCGGRVDERRDDPEHKARIAFWYDPEGNLVETVQLGYVAGGRRERT